VKLSKNVRNRTADKTEVDPMGPVEANGLDRDGDTLANRRPVSREHHVGAAFPDLDVPAKSPWYPLGVRSPDGVEDAFRRRSNVP